ncbi:MAG: pyridoxamine 5'-phosphate oxidase family protein [Actinomycetota bacterium]|nr:pyridoxamine 5'-phosphate oxidase family protein [Actinomycetota bacterium]
MSVAVDLDSLRARIGEMGDLVFLLTAGQGGPHVVAVAPQWEGGVFVMGAGRTTAANAGARPQVTLLWPGADLGAYSLIVDGTATTSEDGALRVTPTSAILHKYAGAEGHDCAPI